MKLECHRCKSTHHLIIEEKINVETSEVIEKHFVCIRCADQIVEHKKGEYAQ